MLDFRRRDATPELMDTEACAFEDFRVYLAQLAQVNRLSLAYRPTLAFFERLHREGRLPAGRRFRVVDAGCGYGDMLRKVDRWALRRGVEMDLVGLDMNPWCARAAREATERGRPIRWLTQNLFDYKAGEGADIVISSLFAHHLPDVLVVRFLRWMEETARIGWCVNDLLRHPVPYYTVKLGCRLTRRHRFMQHDAPVSVASAFKRGDWARYLNEAGLPAGEAALEYWTPFRLCVSRVKAP